MGELQSFRAVYPADRATSLSGVPRSTLYYWARENILVPSVSPVREKLWSFSDLLSARAIHWLRQDKGPAARTTMKNVREALQYAAEINVSFGHLDIRVDQRGKVFFFDEATEELYRVGGQEVFDRALPNLQLLSEFRSKTGIGPNLKRPRPMLRLLPGKLGGEPHIEGTRLASKSLASLSLKGFSEGAIIDLYPFLKGRRAALKEALDLEKQLSANLGRTA